ncbi:hypothetical protein LDH02_17375, partial [Mycobacterium tuberculosis]
TDRGSQYT